MNRITVFNKTKNIYKVAQDSKQAESMRKHLSYVFDAPFEIGLEWDDVIDPIKFILDSEYRAYIKGVKS